MCLNTASGLLWGDYNWEIISSKLNTNIGSVNAC